MLQKLYKCYKRCDSWVLFLKACGFVNDKHILFCSKVVIKVLLNKDIK